METSMRRKPAWFSGMWLATVLAMMAAAVPAYAALGGDASSVQADAARLKGSVNITQGRAYAIHEIKTSTGTAVREYVSPDGRVFGVAWQGPFIPNMRQVLGTYFQQYSTAAREAKSKYVGRRPLNIQQPGLVVQVSGHMRSYRGRAFVPDMVPQSVSAEEIR